MLGAQGGRVHEEKAHDTGQEKADDKPGRVPVLKFGEASVPVVEPQRDAEQWSDHQQCVVVEETILAEVLGQIRDFNIKHTRQKRR